MKNIFLVIGAPGSGKTTDAKIIAERQNFAHFSTGDLLRAEVESGSENGKIIENCIKNGDLVPLEIAVKTIVDAIKTSEKNTILIDGYPRSTEQMRALHEILKNEEKICLKSVFEVVVSDETARMRVLGRNRSDDSENVFANRMAVFTRPISEIRKFYGKNLMQIDGERDIESVVAELTREILKRCENV